MSLIKRLVLDRSDLSLLRIVDICDKGLVVRSETGLYFCVNMNDDPNRYQLLSEGQFSNNVSVGDWVWVCNAKDKEEKNPTTGWKQVVGFWDQETVTIDHELTMHFVLHGGQRKVKKFGGQLYYYSPHVNYMQPDL